MNDDSYKIFVKKHAFLDHMHAVNPMNPEDCPIGTAKTGAYQSLKDVHKGDVITWIVETAKRRYLEWRASSEFITMLSSVKDNVIKFWHEDYRNADPHVKLLKEVNGGGKKALLPEVPLAPLPHAIKTRSITRIAAATIEMAKAIADTELSATIRITSVNQDNQQPMQKKCKRTNAQHHVSISDQAARHQKT